MIFIEVDYTQWKTEVANKDLHFSHYMVGSRYMLLAIDGPLVFKHLLDVEDSTDFEANYLAKSNDKIGSFYSREPFASKQLKDGRSLFRRKHGQKETILANSEKEIIFTVPYGQAKINKLEVIDANALDRIELYVKSPVDPTTAAAYGFPADYLLNQFGFNVVVSNLLYSDKSDYDADVYAGFQIVVKYKNDTASDKEVGFNLIYHEVV